MLCIEKLGKVTIFAETPITEKTEEVGRKESEDSVIGRDWRGRLNHNRIKH